MVAPNSCVSNNVSLAKKSSGNKTHCDICNSKAARKARSKKDHATTEEVPSVSAPTEGEATGDDQAAGTDQSAQTAPSHKEGILCPYTENTATTITPSS